MSKRNRNVRTLPIDWNFNCEKNILNNQSDINDKYFGEAVVWTSGDSTRKDSLSSVLSSDFCPKKSNPGSSSSSLSWSDEYEFEQSKFVQEQLELLDSVLRGKKPIPSTYDAEEIEEWIEFFPNLTILDSKKSSQEDNISSKLDCDRNTSKQITKTVINIYENVSNKLFINKKTVSNTPQKDNRLQIGNSMKITSFKTVNQRNQSSKSLFSRKNSTEYTSLPYLETNKTRRAQLNVRRSTERLILPPIQTNNFRSLSTLPLNDKNNNSNKSLSAIKSSEEKKLHKTNRLDSFFLENTLSKTTREFLQDSTHKRFVFH